MSPVLNSFFSEYSLEIDDKIPLNGNKINFKNLINKNFKSSKIIVYLVHSNYSFSKNFQLIML